MIFVLIQREFRAENRKNIFVQLGESTHPLSDSLTEIVSDTHLIIYSYSPLLFKSCRRWLLIIDHPKIILHRNYTSECFSSRRYGVCVFHWKNWWIEWALYSFVWSTTMQLNTTDMFLFIVHQLYKCQRIMLNIVQSNWLISHFAKNHVNFPFLDWAKSQFYGSGRSTLTQFFQIQMALNAMKSCMLVRVHVA